MKLDDLLTMPHPPTDLELDDPELRRWFWKYRGLLKDRERDQAFWAATNDNLALAYEKLDEQEQKLASAYAIIREDLQVASQIQRAFIPNPPAYMEAELDMAIFNQQLSEVGGDYYDFFDLTEPVGSDDPSSADDAQRYAIGVFDISGHGVSAALVMAYLKAMFMQKLRAGSTPAAIVDTVNQEAYDFLRAVKKYATVNFVTFYPEHIQYVCGGGFGLLLRQGEAHQFIRKDHFLGLRDRAFRQHELPFSAGDLLVLYTDGIIEAQNAEGEDYSTNRLHAVVQGCANEPVEIILKRCLEHYREFVKEDVDDITLLVLRKKGNS